MLYNYNYEFEWDDIKAASNFEKHGVRFSEAATVWYDEHAIEIVDPDHSENEERWIRLGFSNKMRLLIVICTEKPVAEKIRIISARRATAHERKQYYEKARI